MSNKNTINKIINNLGINNYLKLINIRALDTSDSNSFGKYQLKIIENDNPNKTCYIEFIMSNTIYNYEILEHQDEFYGKWSFLNNIDKIDIKSFVFQQLITLCDLSELHHNKVEREDIKINIIQTIKLDPIKQPV